MTTRITSENITDATITASDLAAGAGSTDWQAVIVADGSTVTTMATGKGYFVNTTSAAGIVKLPASASRGDYVEVKDYAGTFGTNSLTIQRNGHNIQGNTNDSEISTNRASLQLVYIDATKGWLFTNESNVADLNKSTFTAATGGTVTTSGDYKIHTFTGDGNFVVSAIGSGAGPATVSYVVVAGGGAGGGGEDGYWTGGGGGAGGFREGRDITPSYTASPITAGSGLTIATQTYPVTVGGGGNAGVTNSPGSSSTAGSDGANSVFSTITSTGGGGGGLSNGSTGGTVPGRFGRPGGSGGGSGGGGDNPIGNGNTPPVSPSQGNNGGKGSVPSAGRGGGGGGAGAVGVSYPNNGAGGAGVASSITASSVTRAAGGAQGSGSAGPTNTGGGGGSHPCAGQAGAGGSGIVIIRYKFQ